jgi:hypothetical protein
MEMLTITPNLARLMLHQNDPENMPRQEGKVQAFMELLESGKQWDTPIQFEGMTLVNGQHRLSAIMRTGQTVCCLVEW